MNLVKHFQIKSNVFFLGYKDADPIIKANELRSHINDLDNPWYASMSDIELLELTTYMIRESEKCYHECLKYQMNYIEVIDIMKDKFNIITRLLSSEMS